MAEKRRDEGRPKPTLRPMRRGVLVAVDLLLGGGWVALNFLIQSGDLDSSLNAAEAVWFLALSPVLVGVLSGRFRVLLAPVVLFVVIAVTVVFFSSCDPTTVRCDEEMPVTGALFIWLARCWLLAGLMTIGLLLRQPLARLLEPRTRTSS